MFSLFVRRYSVFFWGVEIMPRKDSPYEVKHDPGATLGETLTSYTEAKHAFRFLHPIRHVDFTAWCLLQMEPWRVREVLEMIVRAYRLSPPHSLLRHPVDEEGLIQVALDLAKQLDDPVS
jgi:hypothetical protein